jgi:plasmid stabilization system protein ParE
MKYTAIISGTALDDIGSAYAWLARRTTHAPDWHNGLLDAILSLEENPQRCPLAPENNEASEEVRQYLYGQRPHVYRVIFSIRNDTVWILHVRHGARR